MIVFQDLRLVPVAVIGWILIAVLVGQPPAVVVGWAVGLVSLGGIGLWLERVVHKRHWPTLAPTSYVVIIIALILGVCAGHLQGAQQSQIPRLAQVGFHVELTGKVVSEPQVMTGVMAGTYRYTLRTESVTAQGTTTGGRAQVLVMSRANPAEQAISYGSTVQMTGTLKPTNQGEAQQAKMYPTGQPTVIKEPAALTRLSNDLRAGLMERTASLSAQARGLVPGAGIGDTSSMQDSLKQAMKLTSLTHITAVSGSHFAIIFTVVAASVWFLPRWLRAVLIAVFMIGFIGLVHPEPSVQRAGVMCGLMVFAMVLGRPSTAITSWAVAVIILLVMDPWMARHFGFVLSVLATLGLVLGTAPIARVLHNARAPRWWLPNRLALILAVPIAAQLACAPILILLEPHISVYAVPANLLATPALFPATLASVAATVLGPVSPWLADLLVQVAAGATWWIAKVAHFFANLPGATFSWWPGWPGAVTLAALTLTGLTFVFLPPQIPRWLGTKAAARLPLPVQQTLAHPPGWLKQSRASFKTAGLIVGITAAAWTVLMLKPPWLAQLVGTTHFGSDWQIASCDVGQGDAFLINLTGGSVLMIDTGPPGSPVLNCLKQFGVSKIEVLFLTHFHADHMGMVQEIVSKTPVAQVVAPPVGLTGPDSGPVRETLDFFSAQGIPVALGGVGLNGQAGAVTWELLGPNQNLIASLTTSHELGGRVLNDSSLVLALELTRNSLATSVIFLGDLELTGQASLLADLRAAGTGPFDVVKVAHHGSRVQNHNLLEYLSPSVGLVSFGRDNSYGHPHQETLAVLSQLGATVWDTERCGSYAMYREPAGWFVVADCP